jgi:3'-phosphoadenosine 5'-phosphosulfate sulfotransferase (PAPS reductase)/FAD synthetase/ferredoxin
MFKITWDKKNNGVLLTMRSSEETLNVSPRPVFYEELDLLGLEEFWDYPKSEQPLLWACERRYFYKGELVLEARGGNIYDDPQLILTDIGKKLKLEPINIELLCENNETAMFLLEHEALEFINTIYRRYCPNATQKLINDEIDFQQLAENQEKKLKEKHTVIKEDCDSFDIMPLAEAEIKGKQIILNTKIEMFIASFSGGKDSQVVLDLVSRVIPSNDFSVIYSDTGYELPPSLELYEQTKKMYQEQYPDLQFYLSKNHQDVLYYWDKMGSPSRMHRWCCSVMKTAPLYRLLKEIHGSGKQPNVLVFEGVRAEESNRRALYDRIGRGVKHNNVVNARPIFEWNATEIYLYLFTRQLPINKGYRNGLSRVGCSICPYSSSWSECIVEKKYPNNINKFVEQILNSLSNVKDKDVYLKDGKWKLRAGGKALSEEPSRVDFISTNPDFVAILTAPKEDLFQWFNTLGKLQIQSQDKTTISGEIKYNKSVFPFRIVSDEEKNNSTIYFEDIGSEILFQSHLKRVLYKSTYCVHCEACEVECPTGALSVVPFVSIDDKKCIHCRKCLDFTEKGCIAAKSINTPEGGKNMGKFISIDRYAGFGLRKVWLDKFFSNTEGFFESNHGLNPTKQIPPFICWLREAEILNRDDKKISVIGKIMTDNYFSNELIVWEIIWVNLSYNSTIAKWYVENVNWNTRMKKLEQELLLRNSFPQYKERTLRNALEALLNTFKEGPLGNTILLGKHEVENRKTIIVKQPYNNISPVTVAYSLYRYAEQKNRYSLTVSEFYDKNQTEGIYRQFGISRERFEAVLRTLKEDKNQVLNADLNMGLDNINLREDYTSLDIIKMLL